MNDNNEKTYNKVKPGEIESYIKYFDTSAHLDFNIEQSLPIVRNILSNLIVFFCEKSSADQIRKTVEDLAKIHPCRIILVNVSDNSDVYSNATITASCGIADRLDRKICGEIIEFENLSIDNISGTILPLLYPDAKVMLWLPNCPEEILQIPDTLLNELDVVIFDSSNCDNTHKVIRLIESMCIMAESPVITDLGWLSLYQWREMTAQHFDSDETRCFLKGIERVVINGGICENWEVSGIMLLFVSWLIASTSHKYLRLEKHHNSIQILTAKNNQNTIFNLELEQDTNKPVISKVTIYANDSGREATFFTILDDNNEIMIKEECRGLCLLPRIVKKKEVNNSILLASILDINETDHLFLESIKISAKIMSDLNE